MSYSYYIPIACQLLIISWFDIRKKKISNYWAMFNLSCSILLFVLFPQIHPFSLEAFLFPLGFIVVGFLLFLAGIMGAGDSKYLASLFLILPPEFHIPFFEQLLFTTMMVGALLLAYKLFRNFKEMKAYLWSMHWKGMKEIIKSHFSYAPVILLAWIFLGVSNGLK